MEPINPIPTPGAPSAVERIRELLAGGPPLNADAANTAQTAASTATGPAELAANATAAAGPAVNVPTANSVLAWAAAPPAGAAAAAVRPAPGAFADPGAFLSGSAGGWLKELAAQQLPPGLAYVVRAERDPAPASPGMQRLDVPSPHRIDPDRGEHQPQQPETDPEDDEDTAEVPVEDTARAAPDVAALAAEVPAAEAMLPPSATDRFGLALRRAGLHDALHELAQGRCVLAVGPDDAAIDLPERDWHPVQVWVLGQIAAPVRFDGRWHEWAPSPHGALTPVQQPSGVRVGTPLQWRLRVQELPGQMPRTLHSGDAWTAGEGGAAGLAPACRVQLGAGAPRPAGAGGIALDVPAGLRLARLLGLQRAVLMVAMAGWHA